MMLPENFIKLGMSVSDRSFSVVPESYRNEKYLKADGKQEWTPDLDNFGDYKSCDME